MMISHLRPAAAPDTPPSTPTWLFSLLNYLTYPYLALKALPILSYTALKYMLSPLPFPGWSLAQAIGIRYTKLRMGTTYSTLPPPETSDEAWTAPATQRNTGVDTNEVDIKVVKVEPVDPGLIRGIAVCPGVESVVRPGYWLTPPKCQGKGDEPAKEGEKVVLHLHGGGYIRGHPLWIDSPHSIALTLGQRLFSMNYRKCLDPTTAFPAPLIDALAGYIHLTQTLSFPPESITLIGESAGAHLCLILSRYLSDLSLPQPGRICLISPWADFTMDPSTPLGSYRDYADYDFLIPHRLKLGIRSATRYYTNEMVAGLYFSPALAGVGQWRYLQKEGTRVMVVYGTKELFEDEDKALIAGMKRDEVDVAVVEDVDGWHTRMSIDKAAHAVFKKRLLEWLKV